jgi:hypothetical protein
MRDLSRAAAVASTVAVIAMLAPAAPAGAAVEHWHEHGELEICNHSGYEYGVYADGPSARQADLAGFDECRHWEVGVGRYEIGFDRRITADPEQRIIAQARVERGPVTEYRDFDPRGVITTFVSPAHKTRVDLFIPRH